MLHFLKHRYTQLDRKEQGHTLRNEKIFKNNREVAERDSSNETCWTSFLDFSNVDFRRRKYLDLLKVMTMKEEKIAHIKLYCFSPVPMKPPPYGLI